MTRRSILALAFVLSSLFVSAPAGPVSACVLDARGECVAAPTTADVMLIPIPRVAPMADSRFLEANTVMLPMEVSDAYAGA